MSPALYTNDQDGNANDGACYESLLNVVFANGTNKYHFRFRRTLEDFSPDNFPSFFRMHCTLRRSIYECLNKLGDGFRWRPVGR